jgi:hypothetical protein
MSLPLILPTTTLALALGLLYGYRVGRRTSQSPVVWTAEDRSVFTLAWAFILSSLGAILAVLL